ncbi:MAG: DUF4339 domain-containing protein [Phycisphaerae bacterium]|jgi:hypothetical protein|nr:DUF4339 domain-containing protein [Phycisphaerae bacterium]
MPLEPTVNYWIARGQEVFGPYSGDQVHEYLATGNIIASDMIRADGETTWTPVSAVMGSGTGAGFGVGSPTLSPVPQPGHQPQPNTPAANNTSALAFAYWSIGLSLGGLACCCATTPFGLGLGIVAFSRSTPASRDLARLGVIIGVIALVRNITDVVIVLLLPQLLPPELRAALGQP